MRRNAIIPKIIIAMPIMVMLVLPLVADLDVKHVDVAVVDDDCSDVSRRIIADLGAAENIGVTANVFTYADALEMMEEGRADVIVCIPFGFARSLISTPLKVDILADGVNANKGMLGSRYVSQSLLETLQHISAERGWESDISSGSVVNCFNPTLNFRNYMIPALMVVLLIIICGFIPALNLTSEKES